MLTGVRFPLRLRSLRVLLGDLNEEGKKLIPRELAVNPPEEPGAMSPNNPHEAIFVQPHLSKRGRPTILPEIPRQPVPVPVRGDIGDLVPSFRPGLGVVLQEGEDDLLQGQGLRGPGQIHGRV